MLFLVEVLFEVVVIELAFLVPVAQFGFGGVSVGNDVVVHRSYIYRQSRKQSYYQSVKILPVVLVVKLITIL